MQQILFNTAVHCHVLGACVIVTVLNPVSNTYKKSL